MPRPAAWPVLVLLLVPVAAAQGGEGLAFTVAPPLAPIKPQVESPSFAATVTASCALLLRSSGPDSLQEGVPVAFEWAAQDGVAIIGPPETTLDPALCSQATEVKAVVPFQVGIPRTAPGLRPIPVVGRATVGDASDQEPFTLTADYYSVSELKLERKLKQCSSCGHVPIELGLTNLGNARTTYTFEVVGKPNSWSLTLPEPLAVDAGASGQAVAFAKGHGGEGAFQVAVHPVAADDPSKAGDDLTVHFLVRDTSFVSRATPAPAALLAALAVLGLALSRRRA
jgi:hypothetical protein